MLLADAAVAGEDVVVTVPWWMIDVMNVMNDMNYII
jgi:hypothetical protein